MGNFAIIYPHMSTLKRSKGWWGFDTKDIDKKVRPQDNFYHFANGGWIRKTKIPADESRWGAFTMLRFETEQELKRILDETQKRKSMPQGSDEELVRSVYLAATDLKQRNALGVGPLAPLRLLVRDISSIADIQKVVARFHVLGIGALWGTMIDQDAKNSERYLLYFWQGGLGMPERDYYLLEKPEQKRVREAYQKHIEKLLALAGYSKKDAAKAREVVMKIETALAKASMKKEDARDAEKTYHKKTIAQLQKLSASINWQKYLADTGGKGVREVVVSQPEFFAAISKLIKSFPLDEWKTYLEWQLINNTAGLLSEKFVKENFHFYSTIMAGVKKMKPLWRRGLGAVSGTVGESLGKLYIQKYFPESSKRQMDALVDDLFDAYEARMRTLDWMSPATKKKAVFKLRAITRKIGYPKKWKGYKGLVIDKGDFFGNVLRSNEFEHKRAMKKLKGPIDRLEWHMYPHTVNAYCNFGMNEIVFPAGILQWPFFDPRADAAVNYAGIGSVIGHEMTHAFDDQGAKFDYKGNMRGWWTPNDKKKFEQKGELVKKQAGAFMVEEGVHLNGQLTLGENIADLGGLVIAYDAYQKHLFKAGRKEIDGHSPEERFFFGFAQMERELARPEVRKMHALTDPHAAGEFRINGPLSNFEPFYGTFNVKAGDKLYRDPSNRAKIW